MSAVSEDRGPQLLGVNIAFLCAAVVAALLRCYVRVWIVKAFGLDDWLMVAATISFTLYCTCSNIGVHYGTGQHQSDLAPQDIEHAKQFWWFCYVFYCTTMISSKWSIGWFLLRITVKRVHNWIIYVSALLTGVTGVVFFFVTVFQCNPVSYFWNQYEGQSGTCINMDIIIALSYVYSAINVFVDFSFALLPAFLVYGLQLDQRTKIAIIPLLAMGCVASAAVVARLGSLMKFRDPDFLWATLDIAIWSTVEQGLAITAGSLATLRPLLKRIAYRLGLSRPSEIRPSAYGFSNSGNIAGSRHKSGQSVLGAFNLSTITRAEQDDEESKSSPVPGYPPGTYYQSNFVSTNSSPPTKIGVVSTSESQEELNRRDGSNETIDDASGGVVVTKSWLVVNGHRED